MNGCLGDGLTVHGEDGIPERAVPARDAEPLAGKYDYDEWKLRMESIAIHPITSIITRDKFDLLIELHFAIRSGDRSGAAALSSRLGIGACR